MSRYSYNSLGAMGMSTRTGQAYVDLRDGVSVNLVIPPRRSSMSFRGVWLAQSTFRDPRTTRGRPLRALLHREVLVTA
jgi:hypothetical protein